jgi:hypothetical protein
MPLNALKWYCRHFDGRKFECRFLNAVPSWCLAAGYSAPTSPCPDTQASGESVADGQQHLPDTSGAAPRPMPDPNVTEEKKVSYPMGLSAHVIEQVQLTR